MKNIRVGPSGMVLNAAGFANSTLCFFIKSGILMLFNQAE